ncbi:hypothetical protein SLA2020_286650 [Shorea laevis]
MKSLLLEWKGQLMNLKTEVDRALFSVMDGLEKIGPGSKSTGAGRIMRGKRGKKWVVKPKPKKIKKPILLRQVYRVRVGGMGFLRIRVIPRRKSRRRWIWFRSRLGLLRPGLLSSATLRARRMGLRR